MMNKSILIPSYHKSKLFVKDGKLCLRNTPSKIASQHIYILSDEKPQKYDLLLIDNGKVDWSTVGVYIGDYDNSSNTMLCMEGPKSSNGWSTQRKDCKKIVATTDLDLATYKFKIYNDTLNKWEHTCALDLEVVKIMSKKDIKDFINNYKGPTPITINENDWKKDNNYKLESAKHHHNDIERANKEVEYMKSKFSEDFYKVLSKLKGKHTIPKSVGFFYPRVFLNTPSYDCLHARVHSVSNTTIYTYDYLSEKMIPHKFSKDSFVEHDYDTLKRLMTELNMI